MKIMPPERWKRMSTGKRLKIAREQLLMRLGRSMHMASGTVRSGYLMPVSLLAQQDPLRYAEDFSLDLDQLDLLLQDSDIAKSTIKQIEEKRKLAERDLKKRQKEEMAAQKGKKKEMKVVSAAKEQSDLSSCPDSSTSSVSPEPEPDKKNDKSEKAPSQSTLFSFGG